MPNDREELEKQLRAKADEAIHKLLAKLPDKSDLTMTDMENLVGDMGHGVMQDAMQVISQTEQVEPTEVLCEVCDMRMQSRGKRKKRVVTKRGEIELERVFSPLDEQWQLDRSVFTQELARQMVWLSGLLPYEQCEAVFAEIGEQWLSASSI